MDGEVKTREADVFQRNFAILQRLLMSSHEACMAVAAELFAKGLVPHGIINEVQIPGAKGVMAMLSCLLGKIENEPEAFHTFLKALETDSYFADMAATMRKNARVRIVESDGGDSRGQKLGEVAVRARKRVMGILRVSMTK